MERTGRETPPWPGSGMNVGGTPARVFVVDDNDLTRWTLKSIIGRDARLTLVGDATNGASALEAMGVVQPDVVCLDIIMPRLDGLAVLRKIRETHPPTGVVIITGEATAEVLKEARELGADGFVVKPFSAAKVLDTIISVISRHHRGDGGSLGRAAQSPKQTSVRSS